MNRLRRRAADDRGAAAIEFALVLPLLLLLILGILEFGRIYNIQISLSNAAREGARTMAIENDAAAARSAAAAAAPSLNPALSTGAVAISPATCGAGQTATATVSYTVTLLTGYFGTSIPLSATGAMRCGG
ncbi:TadE/TadG family type IV pilus assembly protein [Naasia sp. SYSU D00948]|uniref:TadE/TadG family type IV pilus assembly protein n=1 Tax=Naasia sp. SYSU D00948 TaxID=2817379 RepID=UPI001B312336|nr:TadE/TadG family type IV pilus assembly protein [Naasia sp. SYSU D00948]